MSKKQGEPKNSDLRFLLLLCISQITYYLQKLYSHIKKHLFSIIAISFTMTTILKIINFKATFA